MKKKLTDKQAAKRQSALVKIDNVFKKANEAGLKIRKNVFFVPKNKGFSLRSTPKIKTKNQKIKTPGRVSFLYSHTRCITPRAS